MAEVIELSDDDIVIEEEVTRTLRPKKPVAAPPKRPFRCLNSDCRTESNLIRAKEYVRRYYGVTSYRKKRRVCQSCHHEATTPQDSLVGAMREGRLLMAQTMPTLKQMVVLEDSNSDPSDNEAPDDDTEFEFSGDEGETAQAIFSAIIEELKLDQQVIDGAKHLEGRAIKLEETMTKDQDDYSSLQKELDTLRKEFYDCFNPEIMWKPSLDIDDTGATQASQEGSDVIAESTVTVTPNLPPQGPLVRDELRPNEFVYSMKYSLFARWAQAQVIQVEKREHKSTMYKIRYSRNTKGDGLPRIMTGRQLAYNNPCATRIPVGTRVIAKYKDDDPKNTTISGAFYVGIVAEVPTAANDYRYLIFFDDGYAQYVVHGDIRVVTEASACTWEDVSSDCKEFIKEYLQMYPERPMVRLQKNNIVKTEWNGRWWKAQVREVDGSLVKMFFPMDGRSEWIYRGSTRLSPLFTKKLNTQAQIHQPIKAIRRRTGYMPGRAVVEYGTFGQGQDQENIPTTFMPGERRAVARKSTASRPGTPPREVLKKIEQESEGITNTHTMAKRNLRYANHRCHSRCLGVRGDNMEEHRGLSPLLYPIKFGWQRQITKQKRKTSTKNEVFYVAPCGRRLRNIEEVFRFLIDTDSNLEIDCFSFEMVIDVSHEWEPLRKLLYVDDISLGEELVPISCVNSIDESSMQRLVYCNVRLPTEHVPLNLDPNFLVCCDCTDNCQDKTKCQCWQLTIESTAITDKNGETNENVGYNYRRLSEQVQSGIYECNSRCKCSNICLNRVVQHPIRLKLQLFKTARRGWGVRTLHDIPRGGFICVYVGKMLSDTVGNEEGKTMIGGDDYYADLDYIEILEDRKQGYEEEVENIEEDTNTKTTNTSRAASVGAGSDSTDSDGFFSENEPDDPKEDQDFNHPGYLKKGSGDLTQRERSARLMSRTQKKDGGPDDDGKGETGSDKKKNSEDEDEDAEEEADKKERTQQKFAPSLEASAPKAFKSIREYFGENEAVYIMDAKHTGNIGRFLNHSCDPNVFVQNVFVDTHDIRFPWVAFFAYTNIRAGSELTWDYNYEVDSVPGKIKYCYCNARKCRGRLL